jgi:hypothetical protein
MEGVAAGGHMPQRVGSNAAATQKEGPLDIRFIKHAALSNI